jgi:hypothetical protein
MLTAAVFAIVIIDGAQLLTGIRKIIYFGFFLFVGSWSYIDVPYSIIIAMIGFELIRRSEKDGLRSTYLLVLFLALLASTKFTHLILASFSVLIVGVLALLRGRWRIALLLSSCFLAGYLALWIASGQNLSNIPVYLYNSWHINQGYQQAMGLPTPRQPLWLGVTILIALSLYGLLYLILHFGQSLMLPRFTLLAAFIFLIWKHGFIRSDGHMLIFFVNALLPIIAFPVLLDDLPGRRWPSQLLLGFAGLLCMLGIGVNRQDESLSIWRAPSHIQDKLRHHYDLLGHWASVRVSYEHQLAKERQRFDLPRTREVIGQATIDVLGYEQAIALYNGFTYRPRPVFQSYFAYTPHLAGLNDHFYRSSLAPDYVLLKLQSIDNRFPTLDDSLLLRSFVHRYDYVHTERGFQLWKRRSQPPRESSELAAPLRSEMLKLNRPLELGELTSKRLWATLRVEASWLGRLRNALYKPPIVTLAAKDTQGRSATFRLALPQAATGFILNPLIENGADYLCFAMGAANRQVYTFMLEVAQKDLKFFSDTAHLKLSELSSAPSGKDCRGLDMGVLFGCFSHIQSPMKHQLRRQRPRLMADLP